MEDLIYGGMKSGKLKNPEKHTKNPDSVHYRHHSALTKILTWNRSYSNPRSCPSDIKEYRGIYLK